MISNVGSESDMRGICRADYHWIKEHSLSKNTIARYGHPLK